MKTLKTRAKIVKNSIQSKKYVTYNDMKSVICELFNYDPDKNFRAINNIINYMKDSGVIIEKSGLGFENVTGQQTGEIESVIEDKISYPDIRKAINTMQSRIDNNSFIITNKDLESNEKLFLSYLIDMINGIFDNNIPTIIKDSISKMMNMLKESELDYVSFYELCFNDNNIPIWAKIKVNEYASKHQSCMIPSMNIISMCYDILKVGTDLKNVMSRG